MSLDVYLSIPGASKDGTGIFIREGGAVREVSRAEWDERFPGREPIVVEQDTEDNTVYSANITHNLGRMADAAGIYKAMWRPEEIGITRADQLIELLKAGLQQLRENPDHFRQFNPENGWGNYELLVEFAKEYLAACERYPQAEVRVWR